MAAANAQTPASAFFGGLGGSYDTVNFGNQSVFAVGTDVIFQNGVPVASGTAGGPANVYMASQSTLAPNAQIGYFSHFWHTDWLWGAKLGYSYLGSTSATPNAILPQVGSFTAGGTTTAFTGNALVGSFQTSINHQLSLLLFVGHSFDRFNVYLGAGPSLQQMQTRLNGLVGFADINGMHTQITSQPTNFFNSAWVFGGAFAVGTTFSIDRFWFLDFSYMFNMTPNQTANFSAPFTNAANTEAGTLTGNSTGKVITQAFTVTVNRAF